MNFIIEYRDEKVIFACDDDEFELRSHPYEPCLYIYKNNEMIKVLHNAFTEDEVIAAFEVGETVTDICSKKYDKEAFCKVLVAALNDKRYEMDWPFAAGLVE